MYMLVLVKMKTMKKMMIAALLVLAVLTVGITPIFAAPDTAMSRSVTGAQQKVQKGNIFTQVQAQGLTIREQIQQKLQAFNMPVSITDLNEDDIDYKFAEVEVAASIEDVEGSVVWYLNARGISTPTESVTDVANSAQPVGLQLIAEKIKVTEYGVLYKVLWGRVHHSGEMVDINGYVILDSDGVFYMKLEGDGLGFKAIGKIAPAGIGVRVAMKGYMSHDDVNYSFKLHGRAIPLRGNLIKSRIGNSKNEQNQGNAPTVARRSITPNTEAS